MLLQVVGRQSLKQQHPTNPNNRVQMNPTLILDIVGQQRCQHLQGPEKIQHQVLLTFPGSCVLRQLSADIHLLADMPANTWLICWSTCMSVNSHWCPADTLMILSQYSTDTWSTQINLVCAAQCTAGSQRGLGIQDSRINLFRALGLHNNYLL